MNIQDFYIGKSFDAYEFFGAHKIGDKILFRVYNYINNLSILYNNS